jgi:hypothetical protein
LAAERQLTGHIDLINLTDYGNGVWLPSTVDAQYYKNGKPMKHTKVNLIEAGFNVGVSSSLFEEVIPRDVVVTDTINNAVYRNCDNPEDIQHFLDDSLFTLPL